MKKIGFEFMMHMLFYGLGAVMVFAGLFCISATLILLTLALKFEGIIILSLGAILLTSTKIYFTFLRVMDLASTAIEKMNEIRPPVQQNENEESDIEDILSNIFKNGDMKDIKVQKIYPDVAQIHGLAQKHHPLL